MNNHTFNCDTHLANERASLRGVDTSAYHELYLDVAEICTQNFDLDALLLRTVNAVGSALNVSRCMIGLYAQNAPYYKFRHVFRAPDTPDTGTIVMLGHDVNPSFQMLVRGETYCCNNTRRDPRITELRKFYGLHRIGATLFVPLRRNQKWLGTVGVHHCNEPRQWSAAEVAILELLGNQVAMAIDLIRCRERVAQLRENLAIQNHDQGNFKAPRALQSANFKPNALEQAERELFNIPVSNAERRVLNLLAKGLTNAEIAGTLHRSQRTVESHITNMLAKLGLRNRVELACFVLNGENN